MFEFGPEETRGRLTTKMLTRMVTQADRLRPPKMILGSRCANTLISATASMQCCVHWFRNGVNTERLTFPWRSLGAAAMAASR